MRCTLLCAAITLGAALDCLYYPKDYDFGDFAHNYKPNIVFESPQDPLWFSETTWKDEGVVTDEKKTMTRSRLLQDPRYSSLYACSNILNRTVHDVKGTGCPPKLNHLGESICQEGAVWDTVECMCKRQEECDDAGDVPDECNKPMDIAFVIDASGSIGASNYILMKEKIGQIVNGLGISANMVHVAAHAFSCSDCHLQPDSGFDFHDQVYGDTLVQNTIDALPFHSQNTYIGQAMRHTFHDVMNGGNPDPPSGYRGNGVPAAIIVITDGNPNPPAEGLVAKTAAQDARNKGIRVFAIGAGGYTSQNLKELACDDPNDTTCTDKYVYNADDFDVSVFKEELLKELCADVSTTTSTTKPPSDCPCPNDVMSCFDATRNACVERGNGPASPCPKNTVDCTCPDDPRDLIGEACNTDDECHGMHGSEMWECLGGNQYFGTGSRTGDCVRKGCDGPTNIDGVIDTFPDDTIDQDDPDGTYGGSGGACQLCVGSGGDFHCIETIHGHHYCRAGFNDGGQGTVCKPHQFDCTPKL